MDQRFARNNPIIVKYEKHKYSVPQVITDQHVDLWNKALMLFKPTNASGGMCHWNKDIQGPHIHIEKSQLL
jgi:hypothetical protein